MLPETRSGWGSEKCRTWPADVLIPNWSLGKPVALDLTVTSPLNAEILFQASVTAGSAAYAAEQRKHTHFILPQVPLAGVGSVSPIGDRKPGKHYPNLDHI